MPTGGVMSARAIPARQRLCGVSTWGMVGRRWEVAASSFFEFLNWRPMHGPAGSDQCGPEGACWQAHKGSLTVNLDLWDSAVDEGRHCSRRSNEELTHRLRPVTFPS